MQIEFTTTIPHVIDSEASEIDVVMIIRVDYFKAVKGSHSYNAPSDMDYHGYTEINYTIEAVYVDNGRYDEQLEVADDQFDYLQRDIEAAIIEANE